MSCCSHVCKNRVYEKDITNEFLTNLFLKCKLCPKIIYEDIKKYFQEEMPNFASEYSKIISGEYTKDHLNRMVVENGNNPLFVMISEIFKVSYNFKENYDEYMFELDNLEYANYRISQMETEDIYYEEERKYIENLEIAISLCEPKYNPHKRKWYYEECPCGIDVYEDENETNKRFVSCHNIGMFSLIDSMFIAYFFELITHPKILPIFRKYLSYPSYPINPCCPNILKEISKNKLVTIKNSSFMLCSEWKGANYYYKKIFYKSIYLNHLPISNEELRMKYEYGFHEMICAHPKASHGWAHEGWLEYQELMREYNNTN